ncbi:MAG: NAD-binding protein [Solirubrobacterales bacterium]
MARALIVGCGCRGTRLGERLRARGWEVRGTTRTERGVRRIEAAGLEAAQADPDRPGTLLDAIDDVAVVVWLLGASQAEPEVVAAIHGPRLERLLERLVDTPVRGFAYEGVGPVREAHLERGAEIVESAGARWRIPVTVMRHDTGEDWDGWSEAAATDVAALLD